MTTKHLKADIPLAERRRLEREQWAEIRVALVRRHFQTVQEQMAIDAALARLEFEHLQSVAPVISAILAGKEHSFVPVAAPVTMPEPDAPPVAVPMVARPGAPDMLYDLRHHLGLQ